MVCYSRVTVPAFLISLFFCAAGVAQTPVSFSGPLAYLGNSPAIGDFNGDGIPDLATIENETTQIHIHSGVGNGTFEGDRVINLSSVDGTTAIVALAAADVNLDGLPDLIASVHGQGDLPYIVVLLGKVDGGFAPPVSSSRQQSTTNFYIVDVNHDDKPDLIEISSNSASVALGNGDGSFQPAFLAYSQFSSSGAVAFGDFNKDGHLDLALPSANSMFILFGDGTGHFPIGTSFFIDEQFGPIAAADVNGDGKQDLVAEYSDKGVVEVFLGDGDGGFANPAIYFVGRSVGLGALGLAIGDVNGDGILDIVTPDPAVLLGKGDGTFQVSVLFQTNPSWTAVQLVDLTRNGQLDIVGSVAPDSSTPVILNGSSEQFQPGEEMRLNGRTATCLVVADFNGDGHHDVAAGVGNDVAIFLGTGRAKAALQPSSVISLATEGYAACPISADFNHDNIPDLLVVEGPTGFSFLAGLGDGKFAPPVLTAQDVAHLVTGDFNGDGTLDVAGYYNSSIRILTGNGAGTFSPYASFPAAAANPRIATADLNGDGLADFVQVSTNSSPNQITVSLNAGGGKFNSQVFPLPASFTPQSCTIADLNHDGVPDLIVIGDRQTYIFLGQGAGVFKQVFELSAGGLTGIVADLNGDGLPDLVITDDYVVKVFLGNGLGAFSFPNNPDGVWYSPAGPASIATGFLQSQTARSGLADIVTLGVSTQGATLSVLLNRSVSH